MLLSDLEDLFYLDKSVYCKDSTVKYYRDTLHCFDIFCDSFGLSDTADITHDIILQYVLYLRSRVSTGSIHTYMRAVYALLSWSISEGHILPFIYKVKLPRIEQQIELPLSQKEVDLIDYAIYFSCRGTTKTRYSLLFHILNYEYL